MILSIIVTALSALGVYGVFTYNASFILFGAAANLISTGIGFFTGELRGFQTFFLAIILGAIYGYGAGLPIWFGAAIGLCFEGLIMGVLGWALVIFVASKEVQR